APRSAELAARRARLADTVAEQRARRRAAEEARRRAEVELAIDHSRMRDLDAQAEEVAGRQSQIESDSHAIVAQLADAEEVERRLRLELEQISGASSADRSGLVEAEREAAAARDQLRAAETAIRGAEVAVMEARLQVDSQRESLLVEVAAIGGAALIALDGTADAAAPSGADVSTERLAGALDRAFERWRKERSADPPPSAGRIAALRRRFHELGAGNPFAVEEYAEVRRRVEALEGQQHDLEAAIRSTRTLIEDLNRLIADQFRRTFAALEGAFARRFTQLFDGGDAQLSLTAPEDLSATGIEITARPPGKKRQPLQMLSGGERALTAVALLLAMLEVRPVPFCVLDEVDAALDEANIARFSQALRSLAGDTQFIVITHNRGTIEAADALYGVTIGEDAVSRIVSLRLPPASGTGRTTPEPLTSAVAEVA
ncbi:MAG: AAA family ATPase, partial [Chloroflexota bacterium]|nr:AAA family ATPase [Chloroflexota bacterium]